MSDNIIGFVECPHCANKAISDAATQLANFAAYFETGQVACVFCKKTFDLFGEMRRTICKEAPFPFGFYPVVGAGFSHFTLMLGQGERVELLHSQMGVPDGAKVTGVGFGAQEQPGAWPYDAWALQPRCFRPADRLGLFGGYSSKDVVKEKTHHAGWVAWVKPPDDEPGWKHLIEAYEAFETRDYDGVIVPANVAAESAISRTCTVALQRSGVAGTKTIESFLSDQATYSAQLKVVMPLLAKLFALPPLATPIMGKLNRLRDLRNDLAHRGHLDVPLKQGEAAELVTAANLGFQHARYFRGRLPA